MSDQNRCATAGNEERYDDERALGTCGHCLRTLPLRLLNSDSLCVSTFACWVAAQDLSEHLDVHGLREDLSQE